MTSQAKGQSLESLLEALSGVRHAISQSNKARFIVASPTLAGLKRQHLPDHIRVSVKKRQGPRVRVRGSRSAKLQQFLLARWPRDHLIETSLPSMACVARGAADLNINDYVLHCQQGDIVYYPVGAAAADGSLAHFEGSATGRRCSLLWIFPGRINGEGLVSYLCHSNENIHRTEPHFWFKNHLLAELFNGILPEAERSNCSDIIYHLLSAMLLILQQEGSAGEAMVAPYSLHSPHLPTSDLDPIQQSCLYIDTHLSANLTIDSIAHRACMSPSVFTKRFKQETGQTFNQYCTAARLKNAAILLQTTELRIVEISRFIGLTECQFRLLARKYWKCTPGEFRTKTK